MDICIAQGFIFEWDYLHRDPDTCTALNWPPGTSARIRFTWGTGNELIMAAVIDGAYLRVDLTAAQTATIPRAAVATIDLNYALGDPGMWQPWRAGSVSSCH